MLGFTLISATTYAEKTEVLEEVPSPPIHWIQGTNMNPKLQFEKREQKGSKSIGLMATYTILKLLQKGSHHITL